jgi:putative sigma-54 modulation protein
MPIEITVRHKRLPSAVHEYAESKAQELMESFPHVEHVHVIIDEERRDRVVEVVVQAKKHVRIEAEDAEPNIRAATDLAFAKAEKQLRKVHDKVHDRRVKATPLSRSEVEIEAQAAPEGEAE